MIDIVELIESIRSKYEQYRSLLQRGGFEKTREVL